MIIPICDKFPIRIRHNTGRGETRRDSLMLRSALQNIPHGINTIKYMKEMAREKNTTLIERKRHTTHETRTQTVIPSNIPHPHFPDPLKKKQKQDRKEMPTQSFPVSIEAA